jgi:hypothetical protein
MYYGVITHVIARARRQLNLGTTRVYRNPEDYSVQVTD